MSRLRQRSRWACVTVYRKRSKPLGPTSLRRVQHPCLWALFIHRPTSSTLTWREPAGCDLLIMSAMVSLCTPPAYLTATSKDFSTALGMLCLSALRPASVVACLENDLADE